MSDLISRSTLLELIRHNQALNKGENETVAFDADGLVRAIEELPCAYDLDKVIERLEEEKEYAHADFDSYAEENGLDAYDDFRYGLRRAIEIVKKGGTE